MEKEWKFHIRYDSKTKSFIVQSYSKGMGVYKLLNDVYKKGNNEKHKKWDKAIVPLLYFLKESLKKK